eukprot:CFRG5873T1
MVTSAPLTVASSYRRILRTASSTFSGDSQLLDAFRAQIRAKFDENRTETDLKKINKLLKNSVDLEKMLRTNLVQGRHTDRDTIDVRITEDTEKTDMKKSRCGSK